MQACRSADRGRAIASGQEVPLRGRAYQNVDGKYSTIQGRDVGIEGGWKVVSMEFTSRLMFGFIYGVLRE